MIEFVTGDLFDYPVIAHGVNCVGAMGSGIALPFKQRFPNMHYSYVQLCESGMLQPGGIQAWREKDQLTGARHFGYNIASQYYPGKDAKMLWLTQGVATAINHAKRQGYSQLAIPRIGAGIGGLEWAQVKLRLEALAQVIDEDSDSSFELRVVSLPNA